VLVMRGAADAEDRAAYSRRLPAVLERLREGGADVTLVLADDPGRLRDDLDGVATTHVLPVGLPPSAVSLASMPRATATLRRLLRDIEPDVVEGDEPMPAVAVGLAARRGSPPVIYRRHHLTGRLRLQFVSRVAARMADYTAVSSEVLRERAVRDDRVGPRQVLIIRSGTEDLRPVAPEERAALRTRLGIPPDAKVISVASRLRSEKGLDVLLAAVRRLPPGSAHLVIAGAGPEAGALRRAAYGSPCPVHLVGHQEDIALWLAVGDVVAIPSRREAFGRTTVEAMAAGRPIVASRVGGLALAIEDGVEGLLVAPGDPASLATALTRVLGDPALAQDLGKAARLGFESRHTIGHMADSWRASWETAVASGRRAGPR
jgi:glycosyltransferase involved in cell wall biosynthesis